MARWYRRLYRIRNRRHPPTVVRTDAKIVTLSRRRPPDTRGGLLRILRDRCDHARGALWTQPDGGEGACRLSVEERAGHPR